jgi:type VI secretion system protein ImpL
LHLRFTLIPDLPKTSDASPPISQVFIRVHGTEQTYEMGYQPTTTFTWPGERGAQLVLSTRNGRLPPKGKSGAWAWFRLLQEAEVEPRARNEYSIRWTFDQRDRFSAVTRYTLRTDRTRRLFEQPRQFFELHVPDSL